MPPRELTASPVTRALRTGIFFGAVMGGVFGAIIGVFVGGSVRLAEGPYLLVGGLAFLGSGLLIALLSGTAFGGMMAVMGSALRQPPARQQWDEGEEVLLHGPANHFVGREGVGGHLYLTDRRLRFVSHGMNLQDHDSSWTFAELGAPRTGRSLLVLHNRLFVPTAAGEEVFVVEEPGEWAAAVGAAGEGA